VVEVLATGVSSAALAAGAANPTASAGPATAANANRRVRAEGWGMWESFTIRTVGSRSSIAPDDTVWVSSGPTTGHGAGSRRSGIGNVKIIHGQAGSAVSRRFVRRSRPDTPIYDTMVDT
jgi:hypothetical protein